MGSAAATPLFSPPAPNLEASNFGYSWAQGGAGSFNRSQWINVLCTNKVAVASSKFILALAAALTTQHWPRYWLFSALKSFATLPTTPLTKPELSLPSQALAHILDMEA